MEVVKGCNVLKFAQLRSGLDIAQAACQGNGTGRYIVEAKLASGSPVTLNFQTRPCQNSEESRLVSRAKKDTIGGIPITRWTTAEINTNCLMEEEGKKQKLTDGVKKLITDQEGVIKEGFHKSKDDTEKVTILRQGGKAYTVYEAPRA